MNNSQMWVWLTVVMLPATLLAAWRLWVLDKRERAQRLRLETFRGPIRADAQVALSTWEQFGRRFAPMVGADQQRLLKSLAAAGFKHQRGSLAASSQSRPRRQSFLSYRPGCCLNCEGCFRHP